MSGFTAGKEKVVAGYAKEGRADDQYNFDLLSDMKYDAVISLHTMIA